jgi:pimeloyl-ACP methyl ester carboxylesterase
MPSILISSVPRFFTETGSGAPVIAVHGSMSSARQWRALGDRLKDRHRVVLPDLMATGEGGDSAPGAFAFADDVAFVSALIDAAGAPVHLIGHSYGGVVAACAAFARRARLASLTLIEPSAFHLLAQGNEADYAEVMALYDTQQAALARGDRADATGGFIGYWMGVDAWRAQPERRRAAMIAGLPKLAEDWRGTLENHTTLADYRAFAVPTLLMRARDTRRPSFRIVDMLHGVMPDATLAEIDSGGHMSPLTNPGPVNAAIARFIGAV